MNVQDQDQSPVMIPNQSSKKRRQMRVDSSGQWQSTTEADKFDHKSIIYEGLNNLVHSISVVVNVMLGTLQIMDTEYKGYSFTETGGSGFDNAQVFVKAGTWGTSYKKGMNNFGTGYKCECMLRHEPGDAVYKVIKADTSLLKGLSWSSDGTPDIPDEEDISSPFIRENMVSGTGERKTLAIWGERSNMISDALLIENISNIIPNVPGDAESILDEITRRYGRCPSKISYNDSVIKNDGFFDEVSAKDHRCLDGKTMFDTMKIKYYEKNGKCAIECTPARVFHEKQGTFWVTNDMKKFKIVLSNKGLSTEEPKAVIIMQIMEHRKVGPTEKSKMFPSVKYNVHCEMNGPEGKEGIILCEEKWDSDWGGKDENPIHLLLKGDDGAQWLNLMPNKTRSCVKEELMDLITQMVNGYYLSGYEGSLTAPAFHEIKTKKTLIPLDTRNDEIEELITWQGEQQYFLERKEEPFFNCMCCHGLIRDKADDKMNRCAMGHIESAKEKKNKGKEDDVSERNLVPICEHCNSNMGTMNMTEYMKRKFGSKSENYKQYARYCMTKGKTWQATSINERVFTFETN